MTASDVQIDIILALLALERILPAFFFFSFFFVSPSQPLPTRDFLIPWIATRHVSTIDSPLTFDEQSRGLASLKFNPLSKLFAGITAILDTSVAKKQISDC